MFAITGNKGFHVKLANGFAVSVQFGPYNYCANRDTRMQTRHADGTWTSVPESRDAEVAVFAPDGSFLPMEGHGDTVRGWVNADEVVALMGWAASQTGDGKGLSVPANLFKTAETAEVAS